MRGTDMSRTWRRLHYGDPGCARDGKGGSLLGDPQRKDWSREILRPARRATRQLERLTRAGEVDDEDAVFRRADDRRRKDRDNGYRHQACRELHGISLSAATNAAHSLPRQ